MHVWIAAAWLVEPGHGVGGEHADRYVLRDVRFAIAGRAESDVVGDVVLMVVLAAASKVGWGGGVVVGICDDGEGEEGDVVFFGQAD